MKKIWMMMAMVAIFTACSNEEELDSLVGNYTLTGYADIESRTVLGHPESSSIPFEWSPGDKVWAGNAQSNEIATGGNSATFTFASEPTGTVYYNMTSTSAQAKVNATQKIGNLGTNGDFGYGTINDGSFKLTHATAYLWFNVTSSISEAKLETIKVNADDSYIAGKATWNGSSFGKVTEGSNIIELKVGQTLTTTNDNVWAMVVLPANLQGKTVKVTYKLTVNDATKYYTQTLSGKDLPAGTTQKITAKIANNDLTDYELRVLTFEDNTEKFSPYNFQTSYYDNTNAEEITRTYNISKWSNLIPNQDYGDDMIYSAPDPMYGSYNGKSEYNWYDSDNTMLKHVFPKQSGMDWSTGTGETYEFYNYQASGHVLSKSHTTTVNSSDSFEKERYVYGTSAHSGSNFCVHHGYMDEWKSNNGSQTNLPILEFGDGIARVIDHMYVNNTVYTYNKLVNGESAFGGTFLPTHEGIFKIVAKGYKTATDTNPTTIEFKLRDENKNVVDSWTKWDLSGLGKVVKVEFNVVGTGTMIGNFGLMIPAYFAYDDVAVQF